MIMMIDWHRLFRASITAKTGGVVNKTASFSFANNIPFSVYEFYGDAIFLLIQNLVRVIVNQPPGKKARFGSIMFL